MSGQPRTSLSASLSKEALISLGSMEGVYALPLVERRAPAGIEIVSKPPPKPLPTWPAWAAASGIAIAAWAIHFLPFPPFQLTGEFGVRRPVSPAIVAILIGVAARNLLNIEAIGEAARSVARRVLPITIVLTGAGLSAAQVSAVGVRSLIIIGISIASALGAAWIFGRMLGLGKRARILVGAGTAICGNTAIIAVAPLIDAEDRDLMLSIGAINLLGLSLMFASPLAGAWMGMSEQTYGVWAGVTIHAVPQAVAAGFAFSHTAGALATLVKLVRVAMLAPLMLLVAAAYAHQRKSKIQVRYWRLVPLFLWGFLVLFALNSLKLLPALAFDNGVSVPVSTILTEAGTLSLSLSMAAIGLELNGSTLVKVGGAAVATGLAATITLCVVSFAMIRWWL